MSALLSDKQSERLRFAEDYGDKVEAELEKTQLENAGLRTQLAEVTAERDKLLGVLECANNTAKRRGEERDRLLSILNCPNPICPDGCGTAHFAKPEPEDDPHLNTEMACILSTKLFNSVLLGGPKESKAEAPKCCVCHGSGYYNTTSGDYKWCFGTGIDPDHTEQNN